MAVQDPFEHVASLILTNHRHAGIAPSASVAREVRSVAVVGAGTMGASIAAANVRRQVPVVITDVDPGALDRVAERIAAEVGDNGSPADPAALQEVARWVEPTMAPARIGACDLVIESVTESAAAKQEVYGRLERHLPASTLLASNTSTIPIGRLAECLADGGRFCGLHFFHPVRRRPLVEVVRGPQTRQETIDAAVGYVKRIGKMPIVVDDGPGFLVNRLLVPYLTEALELLLDGATIDAVERAATEFGMAFGPLRLLDEIGLDTALLAGRVLWEAFPERFVASPLPVAMYKAGRLGRKSGKGFFCYPEGLDLDEPGEPDPAIEPILAAWARPPRQLPPETITARLLLPMVLEATRLLEEGTVRDPRDIERGVVFGLGFPMARGGLLYWADAFGTEKILAMLRDLEPLGARFQPTAMLLDMAGRKGRFLD